MSHADHMLSDTIFNVERALERELENEDPSPMFELEDETVLFLYCWTLNEMQIPATRDRSTRRATTQSRP